MTQEEWVDLAHKIALKYHGSQLDKSGEPYINHLKRVSARGKTTQEMIVGMLHDILEDTPCTILEAAASFGNDCRIAKAILDLTHGPEEIYIDYVKRIRVLGGLAHKVKVYDVLDNVSFERISKLDPETQYRLVGKYYAALRILTNKDFANRAFLKEVFSGAYPSDFSEEFGNPVTLACRRLYSDLLSGRRKVKLYSKPRLRKKHQRRD